MKQGKPLKRRKGLKRGDKPLERGEGLKADPEAVRAFQQRSREASTFAQHVGSSVERQQSGRRSGKRKVTVPAAVRTEALGRSLGVCVMCLHREAIDPHRISLAALRQLVRRGRLHEGVQFHHVLPERMWPEFAKVAANGVGLCPGCHEAHEKPGVNDGRLPWEALHAAVRLFVAGLASSDGQVAAYVMRTYRGAPEFAGASGQDTAQDSGTVVELQPATAPGPPRGITNPR